jgi:diguanylate cyclase (GGDEF)-like protein
MSRIQLARRLSQGMSPPARVDRMSVVDQSVYGTLVGAQERLSFARHRDRVTRLINFSSLLRQLQRSVRHAQQHATGHAFLLLDIDSFHLVNEVYDDIDGDQVLLEFARMLAQLNERRSLSARMEQDSFGILLAYRGEREAVEFAERVRTDISESSLTIAGEKVSFTVTIGVAPIVQSTPSADTVIEQARSALELAKSQGGNQSMAYAIEQEQLLGYQRERERALRELEQALSTDGLVLRAQPIVQSAMDGSEPVSHHYEVLLSVRQPDGSLTSPQRVIADAERFGYMSMLDRWVVREVCSWLSGLMDRQKVIPLLAVNLSGSSLSEDSFLDYVLEQISEFGVGTSRLCFEITEGGAVGNLNKSADFVRTLRNIGCKFSLDNFGTGLSSYTYLRELPVDYVKIDGSFIAGMFDNETDAAMIRSINDLAHFLGQQTIAARVESLEGIEALRGMGVDYLQGWGVGRLRELSLISEDLEPVET